MNYKILFYVECSVEDEPNFSIAFQTPVTPFYENLSNNLDADETKSFFKKVFGNASGEKFGIEILKISQLGGFMDIEEGFDPEEFMNEL